MNHEGLKANSISQPKLNDLFNEPNSMNETELLKVLGALSEKLKQLESTQRTSQFKEKSSVKATAGPVECNFQQTCYAAKFKMGSCPCELLR